MSAPLGRVEAIFHGALELSGPEREAFVERSCAGDPDLLRDVNSLLRHSKEPTAMLRAALQPIAQDLLKKDPAELELVAGVMLGPYRVEGKLGEGGMGSVYIATDTRLGRKVAIKSISRRFAGSVSTSARFLREARSAAALSHPNVATIYDVGTTGDTPWLVMEHVDGVSLRARLTGPLCEKVWTQYAHEIADALAHAHSRGILHRDIKPENILITRDDHVKVIDFGLARTVHAEPESAITEPTQFVGTLAYAAPELWGGGAASARSDVYSLGVVLYEMACGKPPFVGLNHHALISSILSGDYPECRTRNPRISAVAAAIIERSMAREPALRYKDAGEIVAALQGAGEAAGLRGGNAGLPTLAIMDFRNIGGAAEVDWLGMGIAETLSADLAKAGSVRVASRSRVVETLRRLGRPLNDIGAASDLGQELGARWIVTGGYQQTGDRIRVTAALVDAAGGNTLSAEKVDGRWADIFEVQDRVVTAVLQTLQLGFEKIKPRTRLSPETRDIAAYEHYVLGRQKMYEMRGKSLSAAIDYFERAIAIDPDYALAYSGLGTANALQFIRTSNPDQVVRAAAYLERAIELDPELGEAYPWLCNIRLRKNDPKGSFAAGKKGVELQPDLAEAQYFCGASSYMVPEFEPGLLYSAISHLCEAIRLQPRFHAAWLVLGAASAFLGKHADAIRILTEAVRMESEADLMYRFVGARTLLAIAHTRMGSWEPARTLYLEALEALRGTDHIYTTCFEVISICGLGENELRCGNESAAITHFRRARRMIRESPRVSGGPRLAIRVTAGLAASYAMAGNVPRARELAAEAARQLETVAGQTATATFECSPAQLWLQLAAAEAGLLNVEGAAACLDRAQKLGWLDGAWLANDPELRELHGHPAFESFTAQLASAPDIQLPVFGDRQNDTKLQDRSETS